MIFLYSNWRALSLPTRALIAKQFGIAKVGTTHVINNEVVSDGYKVEDVERALNIDAIQQYLGVEKTDMQVLWDLMVAKVEGREQTSETPIEETITIEKITITPVKKIGRKPKTK